MNEGRELGKLMQVKTFATISLVHGADSIPRQRTFTARRRKLHALQPVSNNLHPQNNDVHTPGARSTAGIDVKQIRVISRCALKALSLGVGALPVAMRNDVGFRRGGTRKVPVYSVSVITDGTAVHV